MMKELKEMNDVKIFSNSEFGEIRTVTIDNEPWFVGKDVAEALGYSEPRSAVSKKVDEADKGVAEMETPSGKQNMTVINESGLYALIFGSKLESAKRFKHWVTSEVLPAIRRHGAYMTDQTLEKALTSPDFLIQLATQLKKEQEKNVALAADNERMKPKEIFADAVAASHTSILIGDLAKLLKQNGVETGQKRLFGWLREHGYLIKRKGTDWNTPTQKAMDRKLFEVKETVVNNPDGSVRINRTTKVTGKGQQYFINKFINKGVNI